MLLQNIQNHHYDKNFISYLSLFVTDCTFCVVFVIYFNIYLYASTLCIFSIPVCNKVIHEILSNIDTVVMDIRDESQTAKLLFCLKSSIKNQYSQKLLINFFPVYSYHSTY